MESAKSRVDEGRVHNPSREREESRADDPGSVTNEQTPFPGRSISQLPSGPGTRALRQEAVLQMQRTHGNSVVMRQLASDVQRQDETESTSEVAGRTGEGNGPSEISSGGSSVTDTAGGVDVNGPMVNLHATEVNADGVVRASTIIADNVIASSCTPGVGNFW